MREVNERTTCYLQVTFFDKAGQLAEPSRVDWRLDDITTGQAVVPLTQITPGATVEITVLAAYNAMRSPGNAREQRRVTVIAEYGMGDQVTGQWDYHLVNLSGVD